MESRGIHPYIYMDGEDNQHKVIVIIHEFKSFESFIYKDIPNMGIDICCTCLDAYSIQPETIFMIRVSLYIRLIENIRVIRRK